jgi:hypothetical protein
VDPPLGPGLLEQREYLLGSLSGIGLPAQRMADATAAIVAFVDAIAAIEADGEQVERTPGCLATCGGLRGSRSGTTSSMRARYPAMTSVWYSDGFDAGAAEATVRTHEFSLTQLLTGIEATIASSPR